MESTSVYGLELLVLEGTGGKALATDHCDPALLVLVMLVSQNVFHVVFRDFDSFVKQRTCS